MYYGKEIDLKTDLPILTATVIPNRGAWLEYETDANEIFWVRIDKNRKIPITCLIRALGLKTDQEILDLFGDDPGSSPPWRRTPARAMRRPCWRSTGASVPASPPRWRPLRP